MIHCVVVMAYTEIDLLVSTYQTGQTDLGDNLVGHNCGMTKAELDEEGSMSHEGED